MAKNYYVTLGIGRGANLNQIKKAYRKVAKRVHPDTTQSINSDKFREVSEAYETLANENARRQYDAKLKRQSVPMSVSSVADDIPSRRAPFNEMKRFESLIDEFFEGFVPGFFREQRYGSPQKDLYYEVVLSPSEAMHGGMFPIRIPVVEICDQCNQTGFRDSFLCTECDGHGYRRAERELSLSIPPRTSHGTEATISLEDIGLPDVNLFVRISIDPYMA